MVARPCVCDMMAHGSVEGNFGSAALCSMQAGRRTEPAKAVTVHVN